MAVLVEDGRRLTSEPPDVVGCKLQVDVACKENKSEKEKEQEENDPAAYQVGWRP